MPDVSWIRKPAIFFFVVIMFRHMMLLVAAFWSLTDCFLLIVCLTFCSVVTKDFTSEALVSGGYEVLHTANKQSAAD